MNFTHNAHDFAHRILTRTFGKVGVCAMCSIFLPFLRSYGNSTSLLSGSLGNDNAHAHIAHIAHKRETAPVVSGLSVQRPHGIEHPRRLANSLK